MKANTSKHNADGKLKNDARGKLIKTTKHKAKKETP